MKKVKRINTATHTIAAARPIAKQRGVGMIEVLVTLLVLSVGLLGVASLQFVGSFSNKEALARTHAVMIAQQMSERLRASTVSSQITDGFVVHNNYFDEDIYNFGNLSCGSSLSDHACHCPAIPATIPNCQTGDCSADQVAIFDAYQMSCSLSRETPNASMKVSCDDSDTTDTDDCTAGSMHTILVKWPMQSWRDQYKKASKKCNTTGQQQYDCVVIEVTL